jgi:lipopolysaccharide transport system ATP-binding protein
MYLRLAFATALHFDPAVLVIDEVLAVGDARFQNKCLERLATFRAAGKTLILTSHVPDQIRSLCDEVLVLEEGRVAMQGEPEHAIRCYEGLLRERTERRAVQLGITAPSSSARPQGKRQGTQEATIEAVRLFSSQGGAFEQIHSGDGLTIEVEYRIGRPIPDMILSLGIYNEAHVKCFETIIPSLLGSFGPLKERGHLVCRIPSLSLLGGWYYVNPGLYPIDWSYIYDYHWQMYPFEVVDDVAGSANTSGIAALNPNWSALL